MQAGDPVVGAPMAVAGAQSRSEDEESLGVKDVKRTATQAFGSGVPKRRSSSRFDSQCILLACDANEDVLFNAQISANVKGIVCIFLQVNKEEKV